MAVSVFGKRKSAKQKGIMKGISIIVSAIDLRTVVFVATCMNLAVASGTDANATCVIARSIFESKGLLASADILQSPTSDGGGLCPTQGCCGPSARIKLSNLAKNQLEATLRNDLNKLSNLLAIRAYRFDDFFKSLLVQSKHEFHEMFQRTYGMIYERHSYVFMDLFQQLERYYSKGDVDLTQVMDHFFIVLYQKMFTVLNQQYNFDDKYLKCVGDHMLEIQPFDDVPHKLSIQLRRAFVATRTFQKALQGGAEVAKILAEVEMTPECTRASAAVKWCGACSASRAPSCSRRCLNTARACLAAHADLAPVWDSFVDAVDKVADRLLGPFNIAMVVEPIDIKISEAIMNFQEHHQEISQKIFSGCGKPVLGGAAAVPPTSTFIQPDKRDKRSLSQNYDNDFEIEESYESLMKHNPFLVKKAPEDDKDFESEEDYVNDISRRKSRDDVDLEGDYERRYRRDADPGPKQSSKEVDYDVYDFEPARGSSKKKGGKKGHTRKMSAEETESSSPAGGGGGAALEKLVRDARAKVKATRRYFLHLPYLLCEEPSDSCFNGTHTASYSLPLAGEGTAALASNPELRASPSAVPRSIQITLRTLTTKLNNAYNGILVQWNDYEETTAASSRSMMSTSFVQGSGSGSGDFPDDDFDDDEDQPRRQSTGFDEEQGSGDDMLPTTDSSATRELNPPAPSPEAPHEPQTDPPPITARPPVAAAATNHMPLPQALVTYLFPVVCAWVGGLVNDIV